MSKKDTKSYEEFTTVQKEYHAAILKAARTNKKLVELSGEAPERMVMLIERDFRWMGNIIKFSGKKVTIA